MNRTETNIHFSNKLLDKLEKFSKDQINKLDPEDQEKMLRTLESTLRQGITPIERYYDDLKDHFKIPSKFLLNYDK